MDATSGHDLKAVCLFIARDSIPLAAIFADRILRAVERLAGYPESGRMVPELGKEDIREIIVGSYRVSTACGETTCSF